MTWLAWVKATWAAWREPFDAWPDDEDDFPNSDNWSDRTPLDSDCPDTQPTAPGLLDEP